MAIYSVTVPRSAMVNFEDGLNNGVWGFTELKKLFANGQPPPKVGDLVIFGFGLHKNKLIDKKGFPRANTLESFLEYKPYAEKIAITKIKKINKEPDNSKVYDKNNREIWIHKESTHDSHKYPYRILIDVIETHDEFSLSKSQFNTNIINAFRYSSAYIGVLAYAGSSHQVFVGATNKEKEVLKQESVTIEPASSKLIKVEVLNAKEPILKQVKPEQEAQRREAKLLAEYCTYLKSIDKKFTARRSCITLPDGTNLYTDLTYDNLIIEAKSDSKRHSIRTAIGQLFDYEFLLRRDYNKAILLPSAPEKTLQNLLSKLGITLIYKENGQFLEEQKYATE